MAWISQSTDTDSGRSAAAAPASVPHETAPQIVNARSERSEMSQMANVGKSLQIKGELSGDEDLTIDGAVEGKILLHGHNLTIGQSGRVTAEVGAKSVMVGGDLKGNITADDKVEILATGSMKGDIRSPRVVLADGARFKGSIDMDGKGAAAPRPATVESARSPAS
jgi:cytoskeletal protein CcmA (bactofilin family)